MISADKIKRFVELISGAESICVFTGAGISCPSGIPDFRSSDGLYNQTTDTGFPPEEILSHSFFLSHTEEFFSFYKKNMIFPDAKPNQAHLFFAELEKKGKFVPVVTQNIDGLHSSAGSLNVCELHGSVHRNYCTKCGKSYPLSYIMSSSGVPRCEHDNAVIKPDVVLYEEPLDNDTVQKAVEYISNCELLVVIGTSLNVYPAASFVRFFRGENTVLINKSITPYDQSATIVITDDIINVVKEVSLLL